MGDRLLVLCALTLLGAAGCATPERATPATPHDASASASIGDWISAAPAAAEPRSVKLSALAGGTVHIEPPPAPPARPRASKRVALALQHADLGNAMQFLADAGHFNLVLESGLGGQVSASLVDVEPYEALVALADANGARASRASRGRAKRACALSAEIALNRPTTSLTKRASASTSATRSPFTRACTPWVSARGSASSRG